MSHMALIIEDDTDLVTIFAGALRAAGFETHTVEDGKMALSQLAAVLPEVVVLDLHLPNVSGVEILEHIRSSARLMGTFVILTTADARLADMLQGQADLVLIKPVSFGQLRDLASRLHSALAQDE